MTPTAVPAPTITEIVDTGLSIIQTFGLMPFVLFAGFAGAAYTLYKRMKTASR